MLIIPLEQYCRPSELSWSFKRICCLQKISLLNSLFIIILSAGNNMIKKFTINNNTGKNQEQKELFFIFSASNNFDQSMLCIHLANTDAFFCLAAEEYFLKNFSEDIFILWQSTDTIVVGKHQNALAEINYPFVLKNGIKVARRISGGGTVFHDSGNVNFSFIKNVKDTAKINFDLFTKPVIDSLAKLNLTVTTSGHNDLLINGKKISGNAEHVHKKRVLHHGTLLFSSNLDNLGQSLITPLQGKYHDKAIRSRRSPVTNISFFLKEKWTIDNFCSFLLNIQLKDTKSTLYKMNEKDLVSINNLLKEKFLTWEWNYGYSPKYIFTNQTEIENKQVIIKLEVERGRIINSTVSGNYFTNGESSILMRNIVNRRHYYDDIRNLLKLIKEKVPDELPFAFF